MLPRTLTTLVVVLNVYFTKPAIICSTTGVHCHHDRECCSSFCNEGFCGWITSGVKGIANVKTVQSGVKTYYPTIKEVASDKKVLIPGVKGGEDARVRGVYNGERGYHDFEESYDGSSSVEYCSYETEYASRSSDSYGFKDSGVREESRDYSESVANKEEISSEFKDYSTADPSNNKPGVPISSREPSPETRHEPWSDSSQEQSPEYSQEPDPRSDVSRPATNNKKCAKDSEICRQDSECCSRLCQNYICLEIEVGLQGDERDAIDSNPTKPDNYPCLQDYSLCNQDSDCCSLECFAGVCLPKNPPMLPYPPEEKPGRNLDQKDPLPNDNTVESSLGELENISVYPFNRGYSEREEVLRPIYFPPGKANVEYLDFPFNEDWRNYRYGAYQKLPYSPYINQYGINRIPKRTVYTPFMEGRKIPIYPFGREYFWDREYLAAKQGSNLKNLRKYGEEAYYGTYQRPQVPPTQIVWPPFGIESQVSPFRTNHMETEYGLRDRQNEHESELSALADMVYPRSSITTYSMESNLDPLDERHYMTSSDVLSLTGGSSSSEELPLTDEEETTLLPEEEHLRDYGLGGYYEFYQRFQEPQKTILRPANGIESQVYPFRANSLETDYGFRDIQNEYELSDLGNMPHTSFPKRTMSVESIATSDENHDSDNGYLENDDESSIVKSFGRHNSKSDGSFIDIPDESNSELPIKPHLPFSSSSKKTMSMEPTLTKSNELHYNPVSESLETEDVTPKTDSFDRDDLRTDYAFRDVQNENESELSEIPNTTSPKRTMSLELIATSDESNYTESDSFESNNGTIKDDSFIRDNLKSDEGLIYISGENISEHSVISHLPHTSSAKRTLSLESTMVKSNELHYDSVRESLDIKEGTKKTDSFGIDNLEGDYGFIDINNKHEYELSELPEIPHTIPPKRTLSLESTLATSIELHHIPVSESLEISDGTSNLISFDRDNLKPDKFLSIDHGSEVSVSLDLLKNRTISIDSTQVTPDKEGYKSLGESLETEEGTQHVDLTYRGSAETEEGFRDISNAHESASSDLADLPTNNLSKRTLSVESAISAPDAIHDYAHSEYLEPEEMGGHLYVYDKDNLELGRDYKSLSNEYESELPTPSDNPYSDAPKRTLSVESTLAASNGDHFSSFDESFKIDKEASQVGEEGFRDFLDSHVSELSGLAEIPYAGPHTITSSVESTLDGLDEYLNISFEGKEEQLKHGNVSTGMLSAESFNENSVENLNDYYEGDYGKGLISQRDVIWLSHRENPFGRDYSETDNAPYSRIPSGSFYSKSYEQKSGSMEETLRDYNDIGQQYRQEIKGWYVPYNVQELVRDGAEKRIDEYSDHLYPRDWNYNINIGNQEYLESITNSFESVISGETNLNYPKFLPGTFSSESYEHIPDKRLFNPFRGPPSGWKWRAGQNEEHPFYGRTDLAPNPYGYTGMGLSYGVASLHKPEEYILNKTNVSRNDNRRRKVCKTRPNRKKCRHRKHNRKCISRLQRSNNMPQEGAHPTKNNHHELTPPEMLQGRIPLMADKAAEHFSKKPQSQYPLKARGSLGFGELIRIGAKRVVG